MHGDYSRWTFDPRNDYRSVLLQQGRVLLDADWNEQAEITRYHDEIRMLDVIGRAGGPADGAGFGIVDAGGGTPSGVAWTDLRITPGRYYVDGILCEARWPPTRAAGPGLPLTDQPYLAAIGDDPGLPEPASDGRYALYLDAWTYVVTADDAPALLEPALGGPDTTTRARTVWQVRVVALDGGLQCSDLHAPGWLTAPRGTLTPALKEAPPDADPCRISTSGGYTRLENQLYRVQIHDVTGDGPRFLWSRENGSVVAGLTAIGPSGVAGMHADLSLDRTGRDEELSIREGDTVEVTSTDRQLRGEPGYLAVAGPPDGLTLPVVWLGGQTTPELAGLGRTPIVRRWEGSPQPAGPVATDLEDGITVSFGEGLLVPGDYWVVPARTVRLVHGLSALGGTLDWPTDAAGQSVALTPHGPVHHRAPLAILSRAAGGWTLESDCRRFFTTSRGRPQGLHVVKAMLEVGSRPFENDSTLKVEELIGGITVTLDGPILAGSVLDRADNGIRQKPVVRVTLYIPWPTPRETSIWPAYPDLGFIGTRPIELDASVTVDGSAMTWKPSDVVSAWLKDGLAPKLTDFGWTVTGWFTIDGWAIIGERDPNLHLNGHSTTYLDDSGHTRLRLPTNDDVIGGQFVQWFGLV